MDIEAEVRKITHKNCYWRDKNCPLRDNPACADCRKGAKELCQLFPKTADNPDGYEPKPTEDGLLTDDECHAVELREGEGLSWCQPILEAQAEVSFRIGKTLSVAETMELSLKAMEDMKKAGLKEVVDWVEKHKPFMAFHCDKDWQAKLKEWGIE